MRIGLTAFGKAEWAQVTRALADHAWYAAKLLAGEMPADIEDLFASAGLSLFPSGPGELTMDCTCPDWEVPCKHLAAVFYLLAESFDDDPFGILTWRGRDRESLLEAVSAVRTGTEAADRTATTEADVPLTACLDAYFASPAGADIPRPATAPTPSDTLLDQLPAVDVIVRGRPLVDVLRPAYAALGADAPGS